MSGKGRVLSTLGSLLSDEVIKSGAHFTPKGSVGRGALAEI